MVRWGNSCRRESRDDVENMMRENRNWMTQSLGRRGFLGHVSLSLGGLALSDVLAARHVNGQARSDTSVICLYLHGGPSHLETYDVKPAAPTEYRSVFRPIATNVPGMDICELFPLQARMADKFALLRSVHHTMTSHTDGGIEVLTGKTPARPDPTSTSVSQHPDFGAVASKVRGFGSSTMMPYVSIPSRLGMVQPAYLGAHHAAFSTGTIGTNGPSASSLAPLRESSGQRLRERRSLRDRFDVLRRDVDSRQQINSTDEFRELAFQVLSSDRIASAFDLSREDARLRDRYGSTMWGQGCLLARRLAEAGTAVITLELNSPYSGPEYTNWDDHIENAGRPGHFADYMSRRLPPLDQCLSALIQDIHARGLDERILVVVMGEFGRTPRLSHNVRGTGRDHWPDAMTVLFSGGGLRMGQVVGSTNSRGEFPSARPYTPKDVLATIYRHLGIDITRSFLDPTGRPIPILSEGSAIPELI